jgi:methyl-accepting chemotaxis protein-1 (serine sensor receptor)
MSRLSIKASARLVLLLLTSFLILSLGGAWWGSNWAARAFEREHHVYEDLLRPLASVETALWQARFHILRANRDVGRGKMDKVPAYIDEAEVALKEAEAEVVKVQEYTVKHQREVQIAKDINRLVHEYATGLREGAENLKLGMLGNYTTGAVQAQRDAALNQFFERYRELESASNKRSDDAIVDFGFFEKSIQLGSFILVSLAVILTLCFWLYLRRQLFFPLQDAVGKLEKIAEGDLSSKFELASSNEVGHLLSAMRKMQDGLVRMVSQVRQGVIEINTGAQEIAAGNADLSSRTEQQAASLEQTAASMHELASTVKQNAENARLADQLGAGGMDNARRGGAAVDEPRSSMSSTALPFRPISWRLMPRSKPPVRASRARVLPWSPARSVRWRSAARKRPRKSRI